MMWKRKWLDTRYSCRYRVWINLFHFESLIDRMYRACYIVIDIRQKSDPRLLGKIVSLTSVFIFWNREGFRWIWNVCLLRLLESDDYSVFSDPKYIRLSGSWMQNWRVRDIWFCCRIQLKASNNRRKQQESYVQMRVKHERTLCIAISTDGCIRCDNLVVNRSISCYTKHGILDL